MYVPAGLIGTSPKIYPFFRCPKCKEVGVISENQYKGLMGIKCHCGYEETKDWSKEK